MLFNLDFANNTSYHASSSSFLLIIALYLLIPEVIAKIFNPIVEAKVELETHPVILEVTISKC